MGTNVSHRVNIDVLAICFKIDQCELSIESRLYRNNMLEFEQIPSYHGLLCRRTIKVAIELTPQEYVFCQRFLSIEGNGYQPSLKVPISFNASRITTSDPYDSEHSESYCYLKLLFSPPFLLV